MSRLSLRLRLVVWYLAVLAPALLALAVGSEYLVKRSLVGSVDAALDARIDGVRLFVENAEREQLSPEALRDEFLEWAQLTNGEVLIEVTGRGGEVFCAPQRAGWAALSARVTGLAVPGSREPTLDGLPVRAKVDTIAAHDNTYRVVVAAPMEQAMVAMSRFHIALLVLLPAILIVAATGGYWIAGRALAPVGRMTREVQAITVRNLDRRVEVPVSDADLQRLALTFNAMLKRLQTSVADLSRLTADASHELRTPVTLVRSTADVALTRTRSPEEYREALTDILAHSERMSGLVDDLLVLARADAGVEPPSDESSDVVAAVHQARGDVQAQLDSANLTATFDGSAGPVVVAASGQSLRRLFVILLSNAVRYSPAGGSVTVTTSADQAGRAVTVDVADTGIGIEPADRERVFDRFYRGTAARAIAADGSGLGLSIARAIVMTHGGTIEIAPPPSNGGCVVRVRLPMA